MLPPRFQAWTLPQASVSSSVHGSGSSPVTRNARPRLPRLASSQAFTPAGVGLEDRSRLRPSRGEVAFGRLPPAQGPDEPVRVEGPFPNSSDEPAGRDVSPDLHLPHPLLGVDEALRQEQVVGRASRVIWAIPLASRSTVTVAWSPGTCSVPVVWGMARARDPGRVPHRAPEPRPPSHHHEHAQPTDDLHRSTRPLAAAHGPSSVPEPGRPRRGGRSRRRRRRRRARRPDA